MNGNLIKTLCGQRSHTLITRFYCSNEKLVSNLAEETLIKTLKAKFPTASTVIVNDISGGCGSMYEILVESAEFKGVPTIKQHRMITDTLKAEIKDMHGLRIYTSIPK